MERIVDSELTDEAPSRRSGRRSLQVVPELSEATPASYVGRRFEASLRYGAAPDAAAIAATERVEESTPLAPELYAQVESEELNNVLRFAPRPNRSRLGFTHKIAAVAAVSGLALAAASPSQEADELPSGEARVAQSVVVDVQAPASEDVKIERASVTSKFTKEDKLATVMTAAGGDVSKIQTSGALAKPLDTVRLTSGFGHRKNPTGPGYMSHNGLDFGATCGTPVKAVAAGTVVQSEWAGHSGQRVEIDHGNGLHTSYNHNSARKVTVGQKVERGDVVSLVGTTGNSTGCHLHLEVIVNGKWVNPAGWL
ncbi:M23 family metallopeptidase [Paeniglutamicibacter kerguelensis]|uniref:Murein DD-endopeptidase MepM/ murein hydrolase activator NlpD n=1 Tax=Paeniglutamicibacter kerguelensis TaxID=254788 RepID=A0ABS4X8E5_9MICC|nr:M23 family metallopeptidase [Paeniglutamicibacter kerguelensis]MBP2384566.1 murein DD-endopeptidase MepM/ murein hydrolase activator NlpD [Paeniglutamicibacter kerguelensis]